MKIEKFLNNILFLLMNFLTKKNLKKKTKPISVKQKTQAKSPPSPPPEIFNLLEQKIKIILSYVTNFLIKIKLFFKSKGYKHLKLKTALATGLMLLILPFIKFKSWIFALKPTIFMGIAVTGSIGSLAVLNIYMSGSKLYDQSRKKTNKIRTIQQRYTGLPSRRPAYYKMDEKHILVRNLSIPVYMESLTGIRSLNIDIIIHTSNRYLKSYFYENEVAIKNKLNITIEPMTPEFLLTEEGKEILREKIKFELNDLIKKKKIKGRIEKVFFDSIIAG